MPDVFDKIQHMFGPTMRGITSQFSPQIFRGMLVEYLSKVEIDKIIDLVENNKSFWNEVMTAETRDKVMKMTAKMGGHIKLPTSDELINSTKKDAPRVASLFLGWRKARNWLDRQLVEIQRQINF